MHTGYVMCSSCGKRVSNLIMVNDREGLVLRAYCECPECVVAKQDEVCKWEWDNVHYCWSSDCGVQWQFSDPDTTPKENGMSFCFSCSKRLEYVPRNFEEEFMA